jgi:hypothetical protein
MFAKPLNIRFLFSILGLALLSACAQQMTPTESQVSETPIELATPTEETIEGRYFNEQGRFSLLLPEGWDVFGPMDASSGNGLTFTLYNLGPEPDASGGPGISSIIIADSDAFTIEEFAHGQCSTCPPAPIQDIQIAGVNARQTVIGGGGVPFEITWTFFDHNGKRIGLKIQDPDTLAPLTEVLESLKLH